MMLYNSVILNSILGFLWAFLVSVFAIPSIIFVAHQKKILDEPNLRTIHEFLTPRLGGLAIFAGFSSALTIFGDMTVNEVQKTFAGSVIIFFIGLKDDISSISAFKKFFVQVLAAGIVMFMGDIRVTSFYGVLGIYQLEPGMSYLFTFIVIIGVTNAINLIDGVNGLAGTMVLIASFALGVYFLEYNSPYVYTAFCLMGGIAGFLRYNFNKAIIFMGDTGSLVSGFLLAVLSIKFVELGPHVYHTPALAVSFLFIPITDTVRVFILRTMAGRSPFSPDKNHLHHRLLDMGLNHVLTVIVLALINIFAIIAVIYLDFLDDTQLLLMLSGLGLLVSAVIEILSRKKIAQEAK